MAPDRSARAWRRALLIAAVLLSLLTLAQVLAKARRGRQEFMHWTPAYAALSEGRSIYHRGTPGGEGFPTPPPMALLLRPFAALGPIGGPLLFGLFKLALAWFVFTRAFALAAGRARDFPPWAALAVLLLSARVLLSDFAHGNVNLVVGAVVVAAAVAWQSGRELTAGLWIALGTVLKLTPALFVAYLLWKRSRRGLIGVALGLVLFAWVLPSLALGWSFNAQLLGDYWQQMVAPYLAGETPTTVQTEHINQSLLGVAARLLPDAVAIQASPPKFPADVRIAWVHLSPAGLRALLLAAGAGILACLAWCIPARPWRTRPLVLGEFALVALAALFLSERSWKQHWVLLPLCLAFLFHTLATQGRGQRAWILAAIGVAASALAHALSGALFLGARGSDLAEAYGSFFFGGVVVFAVIGALMRSNAPRRAQMGARRRSISAPARLASSSSSD